MDILRRIEKYEGTCNTYYIDGKRKVLIDAGYPIRKPVDLVIITHCHCDHIYYLAEIKKTWNCKVACNGLEKAAIENVSEETAYWLCDKKPEPVTVDFILGEGDIIDTGVMKLRVLEVPGHTRGSIALFDEEHGILFSGDTLFEDGIGRWDLPGGNQADLMKSVERLERLGAKFLFPGH